MPSSSMWLRLLLLHEAVYSADWWYVLPKLLPAAPLSRPKMAGEGLL